LPDSIAACDHDDGLKLPARSLEAELAQIFLLFDSSSCFLLSDTDTPEKMDSALINALLSFLFLSNLVANFTLLAVAESSSVAGRSLMPRPLFLEAFSSSATLFF